MTESPIVLVVCGKNKRRSSTVEYIFKTISDLIFARPDLDTTYNLDSNNCTTIALDAAAWGGKALPASAVNWSAAAGAITGHGVNPGQFGQDMRSYSGANLSPGYGPPSTSGCTTHQ